MGRAFRERFDKQTFYALLKMAPEWEHWGEQMVRSVTDDYGRNVTFHVRLARRRGTSGIKAEDVVDANYAVSGQQMATAHEEMFHEIGLQMAEKVNRKCEELYMAID